MLLELIAEDIAAYDALSQLMKLPKDQRAGNPEFMTALAAAIAAPESIGAVANGVLTICESVFDKTNAFLHSDLVLAGAMADTAARGAELNILANLPLHPDPAEARIIQQRASDLLAKSSAHVCQTSQSLQTGNLGKFHGH